MVLSRFQRLESEDKASNSRLGPRHCPNEKSAWRMSMRRLVSRRPISDLVGRLPDAGSRIPLGACLYRGCLREIPIGKRDGCHVTCPKSCSGRRLAQGKESRLLMDQKAKSLACFFECCVNRGEARCCLGGVWTSLISIQIAADKMVSDQS